MYVEAIVLQYHVIFCDFDDDTLGAGLIDVVHFLLLCPGFGWSAAATLYPTKTTMSHQTGIQGICVSLSSLFSVRTHIAVHVCDSRPSSKHLQQFTATSS